MPDSGASVNKRPAKPRRYYQYRVTDVGGSMVGRVAVGDLTLDRFVGHSYTYNIYDFTRHETTGWYSVKKEAEATPEQYADLRAAGRAVPDEKVAL
jgi:hypothetical protein